MKKTSSLLLLLFFCLSMKAQENLKAEKFFLESKKMMSEKLYDKAIELIDNAISLDSLKQDYYFQKIVLYQKKMDCENAENSLLECVTRIKPTTEDIILHISKLYIECANDKEKGLDVLKSAFDNSFKNSLKIAKQIVLNYIQLEDNENTILYLKKYLELAPNDVESYNNLFELLFVLNRFDEAENVLLLGIKYNNDDMALLTKLSKYYYNRKKFESCISILNRILKKEYTVGNIKDRAIVFEENKLFNKAYDDYKKIIELEKCNIEVYAKVLDYEYNNRMYEKVISNSLKAINCDPDFEKIVIDGLYTSLFFCNDYKKGTEYLDRRLQSKPNMYLPYYMKAITLFNQKSYDQALNYLELALQYINNINIQEISKINLMRYGIYLVTEDYENFAKNWKENDFKQINNELFPFITREATDCKKTVMFVGFDKKTGLINTSLIVPNEIINLLNNSYGIKINHK